MRKAEEAVEQEQKELKDAMEHQALHQAHLNFMRGLNASCKEIKNNMEKLNQAIVVSF